MWGTDLVKPHDLAAHIRWIDGADIGDGPMFDWITLSHVLEHVYNPAELLQRLKAKLTPSGRIWISTPNAEGFLMSTVGAYARDIDFPRHREVFSKSGLTDFLSAQGFSATFYKPPLVNAAMNAKSSLTNLRAYDGASSKQHAVKVLKTALGLLGSSVYSRSAPELVVVCRPVRLSGEANTPV